MSSAHDFHDKFQDAADLRRTANKSGSKDDHQAAHEAFAALAKHSGGKYDQKKQAEALSEEHKSKAGGDSKDDEKKSSGGSYKEAQSAADKATTYAEKNPNKQSHQDAKDAHLEAAKAAKDEGGDKASARAQAHQSSADNHAEKAKEATSGGGADADRHEAALKAWVTRRANIAARISK